MADTANLEKFLLLRISENAKKNSDFCNGRKYGFAGVRFHSKPSLRF